MNKLESTLIGLAEQHLAAVLRFLKKREAGTASEEDQDEYLRDFGALGGLLELGHMADSGMTADAASAMREIDAKCAAAMRAANPINKAAETMNRFCPPMVITGTQDIQTLKAAYPETNGTEAINPGPHGRWY